ncbi:hypothetical protein KI688_003118 [Linnemannia hyalina]|uniref:Uncharacterized protein n=1 Tax=Linnemannia hyalina TaxID=64524 RepID=A0A9P8BTD7_9FUNG|nr:hypothetical protein KI688_003118 [Linnemannia hyalina]
MFSFRGDSQSTQEPTTTTTTDLTSTASTTNTTTEATQATDSSPVDNRPRSKTQHLQDIESTEQDMTSSLQKQLDHARETTASLKEGSDASKSTGSQAIAQQSGDPESLSRALAEAVEKQKQQEAVIKKLRHEVDVERGHATILRHDNQVLRQMKANMLQKEKIDMENALEQEQEYIVNRLQKQLDVMRAEQSATTSTASSWQDKDHSIGSSLPVGSSPINIAGGGRSSRINANPSPTPSPTHKKWIPSHSPSSSDHGPSHPIIDMLKAELTAAKATLNELEREYLIKFKQCNRYRSEVLTLRQELGLPVGSDLLVEDTLPTVLSSTHRTGGSRRNSSTSVSGSNRVSYGGVPATPTNTPANPAPINHHSFSGQRTTLSPHNSIANPFAPSGGSGSFAHYSTSPTLSAFPGGFSGNGGGNGGAGFSSSAAAAAIAAAAGHPPASSHHHQPYSSGNSGTASFSSSVGSLGSTSPMLSMASSLSSSSGLPAIVPERQSLYRSKSNSRQHVQYQQHYQPHHHPGSLQHPPHQPSLTLQNASQQQQQQAAPPQAQAPAVAAAALQGAPQ